MRVRVEAGNSKGKEFSVVDCDYIQELIKFGWLSIVPSPKTLEEKFDSYIYNCKGFPSSFKLTAKDLSDIARSHFLEVAERASREWHDNYDLQKLHYSFAYIINAIRNEGKE